MFDDFSIYFQLTDLGEIYTRHSTRYKDQSHKNSNHFVQNCRRYGNGRKKGYIIYDLYNADFGEIFYLNPVLRTFFWKNSYRLQKCWVIKQIVMSFHIVTGKIYRTIAEFPIAIIRLMKKTHYYSIVQHFERPY